MFASDSAKAEKELDVLRDPALFVEIVYGKSFPNGFKVLKYVNSAGLSDADIERLFRDERESDRFIGLAAKDAEKSRLISSTFDIKDNEVIVTSAEVDGRAYPMSRKTLHLWLKRKIEINWDQW